MKKLCKEELQSSNLQLGYMEGQSITLWSVMYKEVIS